MNINDILLHEMELPEINGVIETLIDVISEENMETDGITAREIDETKKLKLAIELMTQAKKLVEEVFNK